MLTGNRLHRGCTLAALLLLTACEDDLRSKVDFLMTHMLELVSGLLFALLMLYPLIRLLSGSLRISLYKQLHLHVFGGALLALIVFLHAGVPETFNVHTLAFGLIVLSSISGYCGLYLGRKIGLTLQTSSDARLVRRLRIEVPMVDSAELLKWFERWRICHVILVSSSVCTVAIHVFIMLSFGR